jgi:hypothetical protein
LLNVSVQLVNKKELKKILLEAEYRVLQKELYNSERVYKFMQRTHTTF